MSDPIWSPVVQQGLFRELLEAMSRPGEVRRLDALVAKERATLGVLATLVDGSVTLADPDELLSENAWPLLEARRADASGAAFVLCDGARPPAFSPQLGELSDPERGATLVLAGSSFEGSGLGLNLTGPGVDGERRLELSGIHPAWLEARAGWCEHFPLGVDLILVGAGRIAALPRTTRVEVH